MALHILGRVPDRAQLEGRTTELLQRLIRFNTVNPPGNEQAAQEFLKGLLERRRLRVRAALRRGGPPQPRGAAEGGVRRPAPVPARARGHGAREPRGVDGGPLVGRAARRLRLGPRRARHEEPGGRRGGRGADARRGGLAAGGRRAADRVHRRRGDRRRARRALALRAAPRPGGLRHGGERGRGRGLRVRRPPPLRRLRRREGRVPLHAHHLRARRATPRSRASGTTRWSSSRRSSRRSATAGPPTSSRRSRRRFMRALGLDTGDLEAVHAHARGARPARGGAARADARRDAAPRRWCRPRRRST